MTNRDHQVSGGEAVLRPTDCGRVWLVGRGGLYGPVGSRRREHLLAVFERLLFDPRENRSGFPDLIALGDEPGDYCLVEVKGPGDTLQDSQKRWLRYFADRDIPARVAWVEWREHSNSG